MVASIGEIRARLAQILEEIAGVAPSDLRDGAGFREDLKMDSLSVLELVLAVEEMFDVQISNRDIPTLRTVGTAVRCVQRRQLIRQSMSGIQDDVA
jgi:acyl carrier protein